MRKKRKCNRRISKEVEEVDGIYTFDEKRQEKKEQERVQIVRKEKEKKDRQHDLQHLFGLLYVCELFYTFNRCCSFFACLNKREKL